MVDAGDLKSPESIVWVRIPLPAPKEMRMKHCLIKHLITEGCDTKEKLRAAAQVITGTMRVNRGKIPPFNFINGYIDHS